MTRNRSDDGRPVGVRVRPDTMSEQVQELTDRCNVLEETMRRELSIRDVRTAALSKQLDEVMHELVLRVGQFPWARLTT